MNFVALDLETSGKYPLKDEICEVGMVRFNLEGEVLESWSQLIKPSCVMGEKVIGIHGITNEMVESEQPIENYIHEIHKFIGDDPVVAHHTPFDLGFLVWEFERAGLPLSKASNYCTSLLSLAILPKLKSHRLKSLAEHFEIGMGTQHRALDDAKSCMHVFLNLFKTESFDKKLYLELQKTNLGQEIFSIERLKSNDKLKALPISLKNKSEKVELIYSKGSKKGKWRELVPEGLVLKPEAGFFVGRDDGYSQPKRFLINKIIDSRLIHKE